MYISRLRIENFRNFSLLDVKLSGPIVVIGENQSGKSNLLFALRLILDPTLPDSSRELGIEDFWDGLSNRSRSDKISISIELKEFDDENCLNILASLTDYRLNNDHKTIRLTYELRARPELEGEPTTKNDYQFVCYGGEDEKKIFNHNLRRRIAMELLPALRDTQSDLSVWRRSPLRPLIEEAFNNTDYTKRLEAEEAIKGINNKIVTLPKIKELESEIKELFNKMSGSQQDINPRLGCAPQSSTQIYRNINLLADEGSRSINDASLGSTNLMFLCLKELELKRKIKNNERDYTFLAIEEPEAHIFPHLQRSVYRHFFQDIENGNEKKLSIIMTTHSPNIASIAPLHSVLLLKRTPKGTVGFSSSSIVLEEKEKSDLARYLDVTRAEILFARGIILVEGEAERFLIPEFAKSMGMNLDEYGISICSIAGVNFHPYVKFLKALGIPFSIITDWDPQDQKKPLACNRILKLSKVLESAEAGQNTSSELKDFINSEDYDNFRENSKKIGIFTNNYTLEVDLFENVLFKQKVIDCLSELSIENVDPNSINAESLLSRINRIGKGRFAQRLAFYVSKLTPPRYIEEAINFVVIDRA